MLTRMTANPLPGTRRLVASIVLFLAVTIGAIKLAHGLAEPLRQHLGLQHGHPGRSSPLYFIERDFAEGLSATVALVAAWITTALLRRWLDTLAWTCVWMTWAWLGSAILQSWIIYNSCPDLMSSTRTITHWQTFDAYLNDAGIQLARSAVLWSILPLASAPAVAGVIRRRIKHRQQPT